MNGTIVKIEYLAPTRAEVVKVRPTLTSDAYLGSVRPSSKAAHGLLFAANEQMPP